MAIAITRAMVVRTVASFSVLFLLIFVAAGRIGYWQGWAYLALNLALLLANGAILVLNPELASERMRPGAGTKGWDRLYFAVTTPLYFAIIAIAALDSGRFGWSPPLPPALFAAVSIVYVAGQGLFLWAKWVNSFFATVVRIQTDRGQVVCTDGPYRFVRHPGYVGGLLFTAVTPLLFGSLWGLVPALLSCALLVLRTSLEDRTLQAELPGYAAYAARVRSRLLPGVW